MLVTRMSAGPAPRRCTQSAISARSVASERSAKCG